MLFVLRFCLLTTALLLPAVKSNLTEDCVADVEMEDFLKYQLMAEMYLKNIDDIANIGGEDPAAFYGEHIDPLQSNGIDFTIMAGPRVVELSGNDAVRGIFESLSTRDFAFHQWGHWEACEKPNGDIVVYTRYHGVVREADSINQDIFGEAWLNFKTDGHRNDLLTAITVVRYQTIDRPN